MDLPKLQKLMYQITDLGPVWDLRPKMCPKCAQNSHKLEYRTSPTVYEHFLISKGDSRLSMAQKLIEQISNLGPRLGLVTKLALNKKCIFLQFVS